MCLSLRDVSVRSPEKFVPNATSDGRVGANWISLPQSAGRYYVEVDVLSANGETLGHSSSPNFSVP